ncbi:G-protein coupled receptors family 3 profile domain-containing protein [Plasmodiophora brassicae]
MISSVASSPVLSDKSMYSSFSRIFPPDNFQGKAMADVVAYFGWRFVAVIATTDTYGQNLMNSFQAACTARSITVLSTAQFMSGSDPTAHVQQIRDSGARIIALHMLGADAKAVMNVAATMKLLSPLYVWFGSDGVHDLNANSLPVPGLLCTDGYMNPSSRAYRQFASDWEARYQNDTAREYQRITAVAPFTYDATLLAFTVLSTAMSSGANLSNGTDMVLRIRNTTFDGVTGNITMDSNGDRPGAYNLYNVIDVNGVRQWVISAFVLSSHIQEVRPTRFGDGTSSVPTDWPAIVRLRIRASSAASAAVKALAGLGLSLAVITLAFNVRYRRNEYIRLSSPAMNNILIVGCMTAYVATIVMAHQEDLDGSATMNCYVTNILLSLAFSLSYGVLFSKTYRIARIFQKGPLKVLVITHWQLIRYVGILVFLDVVILATWFVADPLSRTRTDLPSYPDPSDPMRSIVSPFFESCTSKNMTTFVSVILIYKGIVTLGGVYLAYATSDVEIPALNDSKYIGMSIYCAGSLAVITLPILQYIDRSRPDARFLLSTLAIISATTGQLCILFFPKMFAVMTGAHSTLTRATKPLQVKPKTPSGTAHH